MATRTEGGGRGGQGCKTYWVDQVLDKLAPDPAQERTDAQSEVEDSTAR